MNHLVSVPYDRGSCYTFISVLVDVHDRIGQMSRLIIVGGLITTYDFVRSFRVPFWKYINNIIFSGASSMTTSV